MLRLAITVEGDTHYLVVAEGTATLGSSDDNDLVIRCSGVSRRHATVERTGSRISITDAGSKNGLIVDGRKVPRVTLVRGKDVFIGRARIRLDEIATADAEIALLLDVLSSSHGSSIAKLTETATATTDVTRRLLRWVRLAEQDRTAKQELLEEARQIVDATTLMIVEGESVVKEIAGPLPPRDALREVASSSSPHWIIDEHDGNGSLCAYFVDTIVSTSWRRDFLSFVASKMRNIPVVPNDIPTRDLVFSAGIVREISSAMTALYQELKQVLQTDLNVLLLGESGSGKEVVARLLHDSDPTRTGNFIAVNMSAVPSSMLEAELFGVEGGVATDVKFRLGKFRAAHRGTILLDEIGDMPPELQARLLRVVDSHSVTPVGAEVAEPIDVRIIAATNVDHARLLAGETFRPDLLYRLSGVVIHVPPLRARRDAVPQLAKAFAESAARRFRKPVRGFTVDAMRVLMDYAWPGNVRQLKHVIERAVAACSKGDVISASDITLLDARDPTSPPSQSLLSQVTAAEATAIQEALRAAGGNRSNAARILGISRATLHKRMRAYGIK